MALGFGIIYLTLRLGRDIMKYLEDKIINEEIINDDNVLEVSSFLNQRLDIDLLNKMSNEWYELFKNEGITKVLTIESAGIALATAVALKFNVPVVYAKKEYTTKLPESIYVSKIYSYTLKKSYYAYIKDSFIDENDNVLIIDDVVANGWAAEGLYDICTQAGASVAGIGCAIEKTYQQGGKRLRSKGIRVESLAKIEEIDLEERKVKFCLE